MTPFDIVIIVWCIVLSIAIVCTKGPSKEHLNEMIASGATRQSIAERRKHEEKFHEHGTINVNFVEKKTRKKRNVK